MRYFIEAAFKHSLGPWVYVQALNSVPSSALSFRGDAGCKRHCPRYTPGDNLLTNNPHAIMFITGGGEGIDDKKENTKATRS